ncbi:site-specific DNA-methyltransferase [Ruminococcoides intestinale]|uniref:site-specific DNA-methyltransferase n=1 Tax=Ruminococcoides intestinale TaxID=3133162 RepID=UPI0032D2DA6B
MDKLKMQTVNKADENFKKLAEMFPNAVTEAKDDNGEIVRAIDKDVLMQEINTKVVDGKEERYQFTWPDKKKSVLLANAPINKTLRPCREESVDFDNTENLYIEGDNLEVLKLLQETYLGKIKIIYIDPPYNTGTDSFVYDDNFAQSTDEYIENSGQFDDDGNRMVQNPESNGRFHTDWLNMMFTRLRLAKDLLSDDGVIFISIDDNEVANLSKMCDEIFGVDNAIAVFPRLATKSGKTPLTFMVSHDYVLCYTKSRHDIFVGQAFEDDSYKYSDEYIAERGRYNLKQPLDCNSISYSASLDYPITHEGVTYYPGSDYNKYLERQSGKHLPKDYAWRWSKELFKFGLKNGWIVFQNGRIYTKGYLKAAIEKQSNGSYAVIKREKTRKISTIDFISNDYSNDIAKKQLASYKISARFDFPKPVDLIKVLLSTHYDKNALVVDFFSGSATTAEAVFKQNLTDGGNRKFILVQLPEKAQDGTYKNICEIGKERIRRAGQKIRNEQLGIKNKGDNSSLQTPNSSLDTGFRVLKCDSSNMKEVYYNPAEYEPSLFTSLEDNIKEDRTSEDLLFQVMLDLGVLLSSKIEETTIAGKKVFNVEDNYLIACFDEDITDEVITEIAKQKPYYFVMRDSSMANDSVATNFEQIFAAYSPDTVRKVL